MSITLVSAGTVVTGTNGITPAAGTYQVGDALIYCTGQFSGSQTITDPAGWTRLTLNSGVTNVVTFGKIAASTSETIPTVNWGASNRGYAGVLAFRGVDSSFTTAGTAQERTGNTTSTIVGAASAFTPTKDGALVLFHGSRNKTSTSDTATYSAPTNFTMGLQAAVNGTNLSMGASYWIQTTATQVPANIAMTFSIADLTTQTMRGTVIYLAPAPPPSGGGGTGTTLFPPLKRKTYVFIDNYYPR